jgi:hypothetical protein
LADAVIPLIRTREELWRRRDSDAHGVQMHRAVSLLQDAAAGGDPADVFAVTQKAIASAMTVILRADDSSGIIGDACRALLDLHPQLAARAHPPARKLVDWMIRFQFHNACDYFTLDPAAYAPALGEAGMSTYRTALADIAARLGPPPSAGELWSSPHAHSWFLLDHNYRRLAVHDRDIDAVIATHARDRRVAAWLEDTAHALEEIGEADLAIEWAKQATDFPGGGHQAQHAADYWCQLLTRYYPDQLANARLDVFRRWPSATTADRLHRDAGPAWPAMRDDVLSRLADRPYDAVMFALLTLHDTALAWELAHSLALDDDRGWHEVATAYQHIDPVAVLPVHARLVDHELQTSAASNYRNAAERLATMRNLAAGTDQASEVDDYIRQLRAQHARRPRLQQEFTRAGLP